MAPLSSLLTLALVLPGTAEPLSRQLGAVLAEAPQWAQKVPPSLGLALAGSQQLTATKPVVNIPFPDALKDDFEAEEHPIGQGLLWVSYRATIKQSRLEVALKVLRKLSSSGKDWLTLDDSETYGWLIQDIRDECLNATEVHKNAAHDAEGGKLLSQCVVDGISNARPATPLYIGMEWAGPTLSTFWKEHVATNSLGVDATRKGIATLSRQMMMGLRCMSNPQAEVQWVHHDLNPDSLHVLQGSDNSLQLKISGFEHVLSSKDPGGVSGSNTWFRPPEFAGLAPLVGFELPVHSFDASSASLTIMSLLSEDSVPDFYFSALLTTILKNAELFMPSRIASCIREKAGGRDDFQKFIDSWESCVTKVEPHMRFAEEFDRLLEPVRSASSKADRKQKLSYLLRCKGGLGLTKASEKLVESVVADWVETSFDKVLISMLDADPAKRPTPEKVLESRYLSEPLGLSVPGPIIECPANMLLNKAFKEVFQMAMGILVSILALLLTGLIAGCCCCCGACCSIIGSAPSATWTGLVVATYVIGGAIAAGLWLSSAACTVLQILGFALGLALVVTGCVMARSAPPAQAKLAWVVSLACALLFCAGLFLGLRANAHPLIAVLGYVQEHSDDVEETLEKHGQLVLTFVQMLKELIWFTFYPPMVGMLVACFGLWRAHMRTQRERRASQVTVAPGMEMRGSFV